MGEQSYKLALPPHLHVHDVFHINLLKNYVPNLEHVLDLDENVLVDQEEFQMEPEQTLKDQGEAIAQPDHLGCVGPMEGLLS